MANLTGIISPPPLRDKVANEKISDILIRLYAKENPLPLTDGIFSEQMYRFLSTLYNRVNQRELYGFPSVVLNPDFNYSTSGTTPVTESDPSGTAIVDLWDVEYTGTPVFTLTPTVYNANEANPTSSQYYINVAASDLGGGLRVSQTQPGTAQKFASQAIYFSANIFNSGTNSPKVRPSVIINLDGASNEVEFFGGEINLASGLNTLTALIGVGSIQDLIVTNANYVKFCLYLTDLDGSSADIDYQYFKFELSSNATNLYVDHALEKARINNF